MTQTLRVGHASIRLNGLFGEDPEAYRAALTDSWVAGTVVTRYGRTWRMSSPGQADTVFYGRIGFVKEGDVSTLSWDPKAKDFVKGEASSGAVVPLAIDVERQVVSFQLVPHVVRPHTVTSNLQALLNENGTHRWTVRPLSQSKSFEDWRESVSEVSYFNFRLHVPNPNWQGRAKIEGLFDSLKTAVLTLRGSAEEEGEIDTSSAWFRQAMDHVRRDYGKAIVKGTDSTSGEQSEWQGEGEYGVVPAISRVEVAEDEAELDPGRLSASLSGLGDIVVIETADEEAEGDGEPV